MALVAGEFGRFTGILSLNRQTRVIFAQSKPLWVDYIGTRKIFILFYYLGLIFVIL
jgi:hypothetical protein